MSASPHSPLLQNALESIENGVEDFASEQPRRVTSALRNLFAGVLLLLKEKLRRLSPPDSTDLLIYKKVKFQPGADGRVVVVPDGHATVDVWEIEQRFKEFGVAVDWKRLMA